MSSSIQLEHIFFRYQDKDQWILRDTSLDFNVGDFIILTGPNGVGKTTLLNLILGFLKPHSGTRFTPSTKHLFSYIPQRSTYDSVPLSVLDVMVSGFVDTHTFFFSGYKKQYIKAQNLLNSLGMGDLSHKRFGSLSGGQMQKVLLCRVFLNTSEFILLDEPFSNMDRESKELFFGQLRSLSKNSGILLISHDMELIAKHTGNFFYLNEGTLTRYEGIQEIDQAFFHNTKERE